MLAGKWRRNTQYRTGNIQHRRERHGEERENRARRGKPLLSLAFDFDVGCTLLLFGDFLFLGKDFRVGDSTISTTPPSRGAGYRPAPCKAESSFAFPPFLWTRKTRSSAWNAPGNCPRRPPALWRAALSTALPRGRGPRPRPGRSPGRVRFSPCSVSCSLSPHLYARRQKAVPSRPFWLRPRRAKFDIECSCSFLPDRPAMTEGTPGKLAPRPLTSRRKTLSLLKRFSKNRRRCHGR